MQTPPIGNGSNTDTGLSNLNRTPAPVPSQAASELRLTSHAVAAASPAADIGQPASRDEMENALKKLQEFSKTAQSLQFSLEESSGRPVIKVIDTETKTVLRQIPSEEALAITRAIDKNIGNLIRDQA